MKSYISRKLPLTTRNTVLTLDSSVVEAAWVAVDMTLSDGPAALWDGSTRTVTSGQLGGSTAFGKRMPSDTRVNA
ncbi:hypothetical protein OKW43_005556 [Paraburkholderia sp. WC7.3g]